MNFKTFFCRSFLLASLFLGAHEALSATNYSESKADLIQKVPGHITLELANLKVAASFCRDFAQSFELPLRDYYNDFSESGREKFVFYKVPLAKSQSFSNHNFSTQIFSLFKQKILARAYLYTDELTREHGFDEDYLYFPEFLIANKDITLKLKEFPVVDPLKEAVGEDTVYTYSYMNESKEENYLSFIMVAAEQLNLAASNFLGAYFDPENDAVCSLLVQ